MNTKSLISQQDLPTELVELSEEDLQKVVGGAKGEGPVIVIEPDGTITIKYPK